MSNHHVMVFSFASDWLRERLELEDQRQDHVKAQPNPFQITYEIWFKMCVLIGAVFREVYYGEDGCLFPTSAWTPRQKVFKINSASSILAIL